MLNDIIGKAILRGTVTAQSPEQNTTCLGKIVDIDGVLSAYGSAFRALANAYNDFIKINPYAFEKFEGTHYIPSDMFKTSNIDAYLVVPKGHNNVLIRCKYDSINDKYAYQNTIAGDNPMILVVAFRISNNMYVKVMTNMGGVNPSYGDSWSGTKLSDYDVLCTNVNAPTIQFFSNSGVPLEIYHLVKEGE